MRAARLAPSSQAALCLVIVTALVMLRKPDAFFHAQLWAEDGTIFFREAFTMGAGSFLEPYAGYFHFFPRLVAFVAFLLPVKLIPVFYNVAAHLGLLTVVALLFSPRVKVPFKFLLGVAIAAAPVRNEVFANLTNAQWILALALVVLIISDPPRRRIEAAIDFAVLFAAGMSGLFVAFFLPLFIARAVFSLRKSSAPQRWRPLGSRRFELSLLACAALIAVIQIDGMESARVHGTFDLFNPDFFLVIARVLTLPLFGPGSDSLVPEQYWLGVALTAAIAVGYACLMREAIIRRSFPLLVTTAAGMLVFGAVLVSIREYPGILVGGGERYFFLQTVLLLWSVILLLEHRRVVSLSILGLLAVSMLVYLPHYQERRLPDKKWGKKSKCVFVSYPCNIPINPDGWVINLPLPAGAIPLPPN